MNIPSLTIEERVRLLTGVGMWFTYDANGKLPQIQMTDGPHGLRKAASGSDNLDGINNSKPATCFPTASAIAASWNTDALTKMGQAIAKEAAAEHVAVVLGPGVNMKRSPLCGRNFEYFSEDPYLAGKLAASYIRGMQEKHIGTCIKHYAVNNQETRRATENNMVDDRALREIYTKAFEIAIQESNPSAIMPSYNMINGYHGTENLELLTHLLRNKFGFTGVAISDWGAATNLADDLLAGLDLEMPDSMGRHEYQIYEALEEGRISEEDLIQTTDRMIRFVLERSEELRKAEQELGLPEIASPDYEKRQQELQQEIFAENHQLAKELAKESAVLLHNEEALPLKAKKVIVVGHLAEQMRYQGAGSSHINITSLENAIAALQKQGVEVLYAQGYENESEKENISLQTAAMSLVEKEAGTDTPVLYFCGLTDRFEGEGYDRNTLSIPENQVKLYRELRMITGQKGSDLIAVTFSGAPMDLAFLREADAILHMYLGGQAVGEACADLLTGKACPSGKLAETWPRKLEDTPAFGNYANLTDDVQYRESIFVGYRYYDTFDVEPLYPFGYGLSYTSFSYRDAEVVHPGLAKVLVKNTGSVAGAETVQVYAKNPDNANAAYREKRKLVGFNKLFLEPGEEKEIEIKLSDDLCRIYDIALGDYKRVPGEYLLEFSSSIEDVRATVPLTFAETESITQEHTQEDASPLHRDGGRDRLQFVMPADYRPPFTEEKFLQIYHRPLSQIDHMKPGEFNIYHSLTQLAPHSWKARAFLKFATRHVMKSAKGNPEDDPVVQMSLGCLREFGIEAIGCQANIPQWLVEAIVRDANKKR